MILYTKPSFQNLSLSACSNEVSPIPDLLTQTI
jgi:hypothetical protein